MACKNYMGADKDDKQYESLESTQWTQRKKEKKKKKKAHKLVLEVALLFAQGGLTKQSCARLSLSRRRCPVQMQDPRRDSGGLPATFALPTSIARCNTATTVPLHVAELRRLLPAPVCPEPQGRVAGAGRNVPRKGISSADDAFDVAKLQAPTPGVGR